MLKSGKLVLRPLLKEDIKYLNEWKNDYEVFKYLGNGFEPQSIDDQSKYIEELIKITDKNKRFIIVNDNKPIGMCGLYNINLKNRNCDLGFYLGDKSQWGKGYGKVTFKIIHEYAFKNLGLKKLKLLVVEENTSAVNMFKKLGYETVGIYKEDRFIDGELKNVLAMEYMLK